MCSREGGEEGSVQCEGDDIPRSRGNGSGVKSIATGTDDNGFRRSVSKRSGKKGDGRKNEHSARVERKRWKGKKW